jgi:hypothetical protein
LSGAPDDRWNNDNLSRLRGVTGANFEAVDVSSLMVDPNSGQARQGVTVVVSPTSATVAPAANQQFTATVQGSTNQSVTWSVNGVTGGNSQVGYVGTSGLYSAPSVAPSPAAVTVRATSVAVPAAVGAATVTVRYAAPVVSSVSPNPATAGTVTLTVGGSGFRSGAVVKLNGATLATTFVSATQLTASGSAAAGSAVPVTVTNSDGQVSNAFNISVVSNSPVSVAVSPTSATVRIRRTVQFRATVSNTSDQRVTWRVSGGGTVSSTGLYTAPGSVPSPATVTVTAVSVADPTKSASASVTVTRR